MPRIFLTGLSGAGKSTVGPVVAQLLGWTFFDTDDWIVARTGCTVAQIINRDGRDVFHQWEYEALQVAICLDDAVVATGGAAVTREASRNLLFAQEFTVYLQTSVEVAWQRIGLRAQRLGEAGVRPMFAGADGQQQLQARYEESKQWYEAAKLHIQTDTETPENLARQIVEGFTRLTGHPSQSAA